MSSKATGGGRAEGAGPDARERLFSPLIDEIFEKHHRYVREEVPRIKAILEACVEGCGESAEAIGAVKRFFDGLATELEAHLAREEDELFPAMRAEEEGRAHEPIAPIVKKLKEEHDHAGDALTRTHVSLAEALLPEGKRPEVAELRRRLKDLEADLKVHVLAEDRLFALAAGAGPKAGGAGWRAT